MAKRIRTNSKTTWIDEKNTNINENIRRFAHKMENFITEKNVFEVIISNTNKFENR